MKRNVSIRYSIALLERRTGGKVIHITNLNNDGLWQFAMDCRLGDGMHGQGNLQGKNAIIGYYLIPDAIQIIMGLFIQPDSLIIVSISMASITTERFRRTNGAWYRFAIPGQKKTFATINKISHLRLLR